MDNINSCNMTLNLQEMIKYYMKEIGCRKGFYSVTSFLNLSLGEENIGPIIFHFYYLGSDCFSYPLDP